MKLKFLIFCLFINYNFLVINAEQNQKPSLTENKISSNVDLNKIKIHIVQNGDTLTSISKFYSVEKKSIIQLNNLKDENYIFIGQNLKIMSSQDIELSNSIELDDPNLQSQTYHEIIAGDSLTDISNKYGINLKTLIHINQLIDPNSLKIGTKLILREGVLEDKELQNNLETFNIYGPLKIKSKELEISRGRNILKAQNNDGKDLIISIDCQKNEIDVRAKRKKWQGWMPAKKDFEIQLINDYC